MVALVCTGEGVSPHRKWTFHLPVGGENVQTVVTDHGVRLQAENQTATRHLRRNHDDVSYRGHMKCPRCGQTYTIADLDAKLAEVAKLGVSELDMSRLL
ncbi:hypothetical protein MTsN4n12_00340 [Microbacterium sp. MTN4-12]